MKEFKIALLKGDGVGAEVVDQAVRVLEEIEKLAKVRFEYTECPIGAVSIDEFGTPLTDETLEVCRNSDAILFGAIGDPKYDNQPNLKVRPEQGLLKLRKELGLFANIRPVSAYRALLEDSPLKTAIIDGVDMVIYRELTGGIYFGEKGYKDESTAFDNCQYSVHEIDRLLHLAFRAAQKRRKKLTLVDKANVLETSRLWRERAKELAKEYTDVEVDYLFVDNAAMQMILNPKQFDVIATENMFGDIISDEASVIAGSIGLLASSSIGASTGLFEPIHGSFPEGKGKNVANPIAAILSVAMLLEHLELFDAAKWVKNAVNSSLDDGVVTREIDPYTKYGTTEVGDYIVTYLKDLELAVFS